MELMQLQMLVAAAEEKSLQKAADRVCRTPQAVSMAIGKLEQEIGVHLLDRSSSRGFRLTPEGEVLVGYARRSLSLLSEALAEIERISSAQQGRLRIGANQSIGEYLLPRLAQIFHANNSRIKLKILIGFSEAILSALRQGDVDVALVADRPRDRDLEVHFLMTDRLVAIMSPRHALAGQPSIGLKALESESLILLTEPSELRERVVETFHRFGINLNLHVETGTLDSVKRMAAQNVGIGIVPSLCVTGDEQATLSIRAIDEFPEDRSLWIVHRPAPSQACRSFISLVQSELTTAKARPHPT